MASRCADEGHLTDGRRADTVASVQIVAAVYVEDIQMRQVAGPSARLDLTGVHFALVAPAPPPTTVAPHLVVLVWCPPDHKGTAALEVVFRRQGDPEDAEPVARNAMPLSVEPGRFSQQLVRAELDFEELGTVEAHCRVDLGPTTVVPFTLLAPTD